MAPGLGSRPGTARPLGGIEVVVHPPVRGVGIELNAKPGAHTLSYGPQFSPKISHIFFQFCGLSGWLKRLHLFNWPRRLGHCSWQGSCREPWRVGSELGSALRLVGGLHVALDLAHWPRRIDDNGFERIARGCEDKAGCSVRPLSACRDALASRPPRAPLPTAQLLSPCPPSAIGAVSRLAIVPASIDRQTHAALVDHALFN